MSERVEHHLLSVAATAKMLGVHPATIRRWLSTGYMPSVRLGGRRLIDSRDIESMLAQGRSADLAASRPESLK